MDHVMRGANFITDKANRVTFFTANPLAKPRHFCRWPIHWMNNHTGHAATRCGFVQRNAYRDCIPVKKLNRRHTCLRSGCDNCKPDNRYPINKHFIPLTHADITLPAVTSLRNSLS
uniref:Cobalamin biosynthesis protein CbiX n=1 Tax=Klebsiella pneumoniae TaxID=573 RepID=A0A344V5A0_KLEPN|nr:cobalamin biosynthesis protein CbiX [Klebsiella pneumoniae]